MAHAVGICLTVGTLTRRVTATIWSVKQINLVNYALIPGGLTVVRVESLSGSQVSGGSFQKTSENKYHYYLLLEDHLVIRFLEVEAVTVGSLKDV